MVIQFSSVTVLALLSLLQLSPCRVCEAADADVTLQEGGLLEGRGAALACFVLGRCLHLGKGVPQQSEKAKEHYDKASCSRVL